MAAHLRGQPGSDPQRQSDLSGTGPAHPPVGPLPQCNDPTGRKEHPTMGPLAVRLLLPRVLLVLLALAGPGLSSLTLVQAQSPPNIIVIVTDDQDVRSLEQM